MFWKHSLLLVLWILWSHLFATALFCLNCLWLKLFELFISSPYHSAKPLLWIDVFFWCLAVYKPPINVTLLNKKNESLKWKETYYVFIFCGSDLLFWNCAVAEGTGLKTTTCLSVHIHIMVVWGSTDGAQEKAERCGVRYTSVYLTPLNHKLALAVGTCHLLL